MNDTLPAVGASPRPLTIRLVIRKRHVAAALAAVDNVILRSEICPISQALRERFPEAELVTTGPDEATVLFSRRRHHARHYDLLPAAAQLVREFDQHLPISTPAVVVLRQQS